MKFLGFILHTLSKPTLRKFCTSWRKPLLPLARKPLAASLLVNYFCHAALGQGTNHPRMPLASFLSRGLRESKSDNS